MSKISPLRLFSCKKFEDTPKQKVINMSNLNKFYFSSQILQKLYYLNFILANSLREFGRLIAAIEDEKDRLLDRAYEQFIVPLENFRKEQIGAVKERKKKFEKQTAKFCASQERYLGLSTKNKDTVLQEVRNSFF